MCNWSKVKDIYNMLYIFMYTCCYIFLLKVKVFLLNPAFSRTMKNYITQKPSESQLFLTLIVNISWALNNFIRVICEEPWIDWLMIYLL